MAFNQSSQNAGVPQATLQTTPRISHGATRAPASPRGSAASTVGRSTPSPAPQQSQSGAKSVSIDYVMEQAAAVLIELGRSGVLAIQPEQRAHRAMKVSQLYAFCKHFVDRLEQSVSPLPGTLKEKLEKLKQQQQQLSLHSQARSMFCNVWYMCVSFFLSTCPCTCSCSVFTSRLSNRKLSRNTKPRLWSRLHTRRDKSGVSTLHLLVWLIGHKFSTNQSFPRSKCPSVNPLPH